MASDTSKTGIEFPFVDPGRAVAVLAVLIGIGIAIVFSPPFAERATELCGALIEEKIGANEGIQRGTYGVVFDTATLHQICTLKHSATGAVEFQAPIPWGCIMWISSQRCYANHADP